MSKRILRHSAVAAAKRVTTPVGTPAGGIAATGAVVLVLISVVTSLVMSKPNLTLIVALILLGALSAVLAAMQQSGFQPQPALAPAPATAGGLVLYNDSAGTPIDASFWATKNYQLSTGPYPPSVDAATPSGSLVNRTDERGLLSQKLRADGPDVFVVHGPPGAGKSTLVKHVLQETGLSEMALRWYDLPGDPFDARRLCEDIDPNGKARTDPATRGDVLTRLEMATAAHDGMPIPIVVDSAQSLLDPDTRCFVSLELAEAIGLIAQGRRQVKLILVFQEPPVPKAGSEWLESADYVWVGGLTRQHFQKCLQQLDPGGKLGLAELTAAEHGQLCDALQGIPRLAGLFCAVVERSQDGCDAARLVRHLGGFPPGQAESLLSGKLVDCLSNEQRRVAVGLAAYATPVTIQQLKELIEDELGPGRVPRLLQELKKLCVISKSSDRYHVSSSAIQDALMRRPGQDGPAHLWPKAAELLSLSRKEYIRQLEDLDTHFAELNILIRRELWGSSYDLIGEMEEHLQRWNAVTMLIKYRENIAGKLGVSFQEMVNYNSLGCMYLSQGNFGSAQQAFSSALRNASAVADSYPHGRRKVYINLASLYLESGETDRAEKYYRDALAMAGEHDDVLDRMAAKAGLADCCRRQGDYDDAISLGKIALLAAQEAGSPWAVDIAVKLARWHSELEQEEEAFRLMDLADQEAAGHPEDPSLFVRCLDGRADLLLDAGDYVKARDVAQDALTRALQLNGPLTVMQARTTMAMACLQLDDIPTAVREIRRAFPYRREGRSLVVLALHALIAFRAAPDTEKPRTLFAQLEREAVRRRERDARDFAAWDFEGLAICGARIGRTGSLDGAIAAFRRARQEAAPPCLNARMRFWLEILQAKALPEQLAAVFTAAVGTPARPELP